MSDRFVGPKLSDVEIKRRAETCASKYFYINKGCLERIDILDILEFQLDYFAPGFKFLVVNDEEVRRYARADDDVGNNVVACTDPPTKTIYVSRSLYKNAYEGDSWSRMCLAHELGHAVLHADYTNRTPHLAFKYKSSVTSFDESKVRGIPLFRDSERQAEIFAIFMLLPDALVRGCKGALDLSILANVDYATAASRFDFFLAQQKGKSPSLSVHPRST